MGRKRVSSASIQDAKDESGPMYMSVAGKDSASLLAKADHLPADPFTVTESSGYASADENGVNMRAGFNRFDRLNSRPEDDVSLIHKDVIRSCQAVYRRIGLVKNIVDLMADFASAGLELVHPVRSQQNFFAEWSKRVDLQGRVHDFMKLMLRDANVIVRRKMAKVTLPALRQMTKSALLPEDAPEKIKKETIETTVRTIPWKYTFINPTLVEKVGGELGKFYGASGYSMTITPQLARAIRNPKNDTEREIVDKLPPDIVDAVKKGKRKIMLDASKVFVSHYKKDDWEDWGTPFLYSVLDDIMFKDKMRLADIAALDGVINVIRIWKLGDHEKQILPTKAAVNKLLGILQNNTGGGVLDLVWDSMIDLQVEYPPTDKILGPDKYKSVNQDIVRGLGVPDSLLGGSDTGGRGGQAPFVQLKTLVERLEYVRGKALEWINNEVKMVSSAMRFKTPPNAVFGNMHLRDEAAEKALVIQLLDRGIISVETVHKVFGQNFIIELEHLREEQAVRDEEPTLLEKAGPYYRPGSLIDRQTDNTIRLEKSKLDMGIYDQPPGGPGGGGDNPSGDQPRKDSTPSGPGRPTKQPSTKPRNTRTPKTLSSVLEAVAMSHFDEISAVIDPLFLADKQVKSIRTASVAMRAELERVKWSVLCCLDAKNVVTPESIIECLDKTADDRVLACDLLYRTMIDEFAQLTSKAATLNDRLRLMAAAWATFILDDGE